jgi:hypothetical protein
MGPNTFLGLFFVLFTIGILLKDIDKLNNYDSTTKVLIKIGLSFLLTFLLWLFTLIDRYTENNHTLKKFSDYYGLRYGDTLDFNYHIKSDHTNKKKGDLKTPICKIDGNIDKGSLTIKTTEGCDTDEDIMKKYKTIFTTQNLKDKDNNDIDDSKFINSQISDFIDD